MKQTFIYICLIIGISCFLSTNALPVMAKDSVDKKEISVYVNSGKVLKFSEDTGGVKWKSSDNEILSVVSEGNNNTKAVILSKGKVGKCTVTAKSEDKIIIWKVNIKSDKKISRAKLKKITVKSNRIKLKIQYINKTNKYIGYGKECILQKLVEGHWKKVNTEYTGSDDAVALELAPDSQMNVKFKLNVDGSLDNGIYRIKGDPTFFKGKRNTMFFVVK